MNCFIHPDNTSSFFTDLSKIPTTDGYLFVYNPTCGFGFEDKQAYGRLWRKYCGTSYDIEYNTKMLLERTQKVHLRSKADAGELAGAALCCTIIKKVLKHVIHKRDEQASQTLRALSATLKSTQVHLVGKLAQIKKVSPLKVSCSHKHYSIAVDLLDRGAKVQDAAGHYDELVKVAYKKKKYSLCLHLIRLGAILVGANRNFSINELLELALTRKDQEASLRLIAMGLNLEWKNALGGQSHLHIAVQSGLNDVVEALLKMGMNPNIQDADCNTPLHIACYELQHEIATLLITHKADVTKKNQEQKCAFSLPLEVGQNSSFYQKQFPGLQGISEKSRPYSITRALELCKGTHHLEVAFLFQDMELAKNYTLKCSKREFFQAVDLLKKKYKGSSFDFLTHCTLQVTDVHIKNAPRETKVTPPSRECSLDELYTPCCTPPEKEKIKEFIRRVVGRIAFRGTPAEGSSALTQFYQSIEHSVKQILIAPTDQEQKRRCVQEIASAVDSCGGRYFTAINTQFRELCTLPPNTDEEKVLHSLATFREFILHSIIEDMSKYNYFLRMCGQELGIPGAEEMQKFVDDLGHYENRELNEIKRKFHQLYSPEHIFEWIKPVLESLAIDASTPEAIARFLTKPDVNVLKSIFVNGA